MTEYCNDTPLTILANVTSLLTFLLGILASYLTFYTLTCNALSEIQMLKIDLDSARAQFHSVLDCCSSEACLAPVKVHDPDGMLGKAIAALDGMLTSLYQDLERLQEQHRQSGTMGWWGREKVGMRMRWVNKRKQISERMDRISALKMEVHVGLISLLLRKMAAQDQAIYFQYERTSNQNQDRLDLPSRA
ncbi:hypothetical protein IFR05_004082 [Cadophora sp. M221]|nr:hypothetical protein IFR05_004082 [Cadophora sp. M221]